MEVLFKVYLSYSHEPVPRSHSNHHHQQFRYYQYRERDRYHVDKIWADLCWLINNLWLKCVKSKSWQIQNLSIWNLKNSFDLEAEKKHGNPSSISDKHSVMLLFTLFKEKDPKVHDSGSLVYWHKNPHEECLVRQHPT